MVRKADVDFFFSVSNTTMHVSLILCYCFPTLLLAPYLLPNKGKLFSWHLAPVCSPFSHHILIHILPNHLELSFLPLFLPVASDLSSSKVLPQWTPGLCPNQHWKREAVLASLWRFPCFHAPFTSCKCYHCSSHRGPQAFLIVCPPREIIHLKTIR